VGGTPALPDTPPVDVADPIVTDVVVADTGPETPQCDPGEGCFMDQCIDNHQCQSGWCVDHMGEGVCTKPCQEDCPVGWKCKQVAATDPDVVYLCVSDHSNLCRPCADGSDCKSPVGAEDVCVDYGSEGSFCGTVCEDDDSCPWGFSCVDALTVDGIETRQCVADSGTCPCTSKSVALSLWTPCAVENEWGSCAGKRICTDSGLTGCDATIPAAETCNTLDDDCDGEVDEATLVEGEYVALCDDANPCTDDACLAEGGCQNSPVDGGECLDGDPCTVADHCDAGSCVGEPVECTDDNPCTDDLCTVVGGCEFPPAVGACDDGDACTVADQCEQGQCVGVALPCECAVDADCADLEDGDLCNGTLFCDTAQLPYSCAVAEATLVVCAEADAFCQQAHCEPSTGACSVVAAHEGLPCDDGDACTVNEKCVAAACEGGAALNCNDGNPCTDDVCGVAGCEHTDNSQPCSDGDVCTVGDACSAGACSPGSALDCDDGNGCTDDACSAATGCTHTAAAGQCDDGSACTVGDACSAGVCQPGGPPACDDGKQCTLDTCDPGSGCVATPIDGGCTDGDPCTLNDYCAAGACVSGATPDCDDGNPCTDDSCGAQGLCVNAANTGQCDDGNVCTTGDNCGDGACKTSGALDCDDGKSCTQDSCDAADGCINEAIEGGCTDGDPCTLNDYCAAGACVPGATPNCDDANPCTDDACADTGLCVHTPNDAACSDKNACTLGDHCAGGVCASTGALGCGDSNVCTNDSCDALLGCLHDLLTGPSCDDGDKCNGDDVCATGKCVAGVAPDCDDKNACTDDSCDKTTGCVHTPTAPGPCDDGNQCTVDDQCVAGTCVPGAAKTCTDNNGCTDDVCVPGAGCIHSNNTDTCQDGSLCTVGDACLGGVCVPGTDTFTCDDEDACTTDTCDTGTNACKFAPMANATPCGTGKWCWNGACVNTQPGTFCFTGPEKATMSGKDICNNLFGLPCGPGTTKTFVGTTCTGQMIDSGRGCNEQPLDPYSAGSALLVCGGG